MTAGTVTLAPMTREMCHALYRGWQNDPSVFADQSLFKPYVYDAGAVDRYYDSRRSPRRMLLAILLDGAPIGEVQFKRIDRQRRECSLGIHLQSDTVKGRGYGTQAERLALRFAFERLGMTAVNADTILKNTRSQHVLEKVGCRFTHEADGFRYYRIKRPAQKQEDTTMQDIIARDLLSIGAVFLRPDEPFTWASGIKSPIYCDNRLTLTAPAVRNDVENGLVALIRREYADVEVLMGTSTAGIAHAAIVGHLMGLPMGYVRSSAKDHGRGNQIEGRLEPDQKVVVVEDLISTAGSCVEVVNALREAGAVVLGIASIFTYGMKKGLDRLAEANVRNVSLTNLDAVAEVAAREGYIRDEDVERLLRFRDDPSDESWIGGRA